MWQIARMAGISGVAPAAAAQHPGAQPREQRQTSAQAEFGAAAVHGDAAREKLRIAPAAPADLMRAPSANAQERLRRQRLLGEKLTQRTRAYAERKARKGALYDIEA